MYTTAVLSTWTQCRAILQTLSLKTCTTFVHYSGPIDLDPSAEQSFKHFLRRHVQRCRTRSSRKLSPKSCTTFVHYSGPCRTRSSRKLGGQRCHCHLSASPAPVGRYQRRGTLGVTMEPNLQQDGRRYVKSAPVDYRYNCPWNDWTPPLDPRRRFIAAQIEQKRKSSISL